jgi:hypothetical protein
MTNEMINPENGKKDENKNHIYGLRFLHAEFANLYQLLRMAGCMAYHVLMSCNFM